MKYIKIYNLRVQTFLQLLTAKALIQSRLYNASKKKQILQSIKSKTLSIKNKL